MRALSATKKDKPRLAILGVGNPLNGDDAAGVMAVRRLAAHRHGDDWLIVEAGLAPENFTGSVRRFAPDLVLFIDAAQMDLAPGAVRWLDWREALGFTASTHTLPLSLTAKFLAAELACSVALLGIQPADTTLNAPLSAPVEAAVAQVVDGLRAVLEQISIGNILESPT